MKLKFWGVRGSLPAPLLNQSIQTKLVSALMAAGTQNVDLTNIESVQEFVNKLPPNVNTTFGGNTTCITVESDKQLLIFDAGSGIRELGRHLMKREFGRGQGHASIFFTHTHWDHIQGFPFFVPIFVPGNKFDIYYVHPHVPDILKQQMSSEVYPIDFQDLESEITFHQVEPDGTVQIDQMRISNTALEHPGTAYSYRIDSDDYAVILATDGEYKQLGSSHTKRYIDFFHEADLLIFDAMFSVRESFIKADWGHSSGLIGVDIARSARVKHLVMFHHDPASDDDEIMRALKQTQEYAAQQDDGVPIKVDIAREGWEIDFYQDSNFAIDENDINDVVCLSLSGRFDAQASEAFTRHIENVVKDGATKKVVLDMDNLENMTIAGVHALLDARRIVYSLSIVNLPKSAHRVIELAGTTDFFAIYDSMSDIIDMSGASSKQRPN